MKRIVFLLISAVLCICMAVAAFAAEAGKVGFISNAWGNDNDDGLSDTSPKQHQGKVGGIGIREMLYNGGTIVVVGDFHISSNETWDYNGPMTVTGNYNGKDYKNAGANTGVFQLHSGKTLTVSGELTFDDLLFYPEGPRCRILVPNGATLTITETVSMLTEALCIEVEEGGKANILGGKYLSVEGEGEITVGENVELMEEAVVFVSRTSGDNTDDGLSAKNPKRDLGSANRRGIFNQIKGGGVIVACGDFLIPGSYDWSFGRGITITGSYDGTDYKDLDDYKGVVELEDQTTLTVSSDLTLDNVYLAPGKTRSVILVKKGATLTITDTVETLEDTVAIVVEPGAKADIAGGTYLSIQGAGDITLGEKVKELQASIPAYISNANGNDENDGFSAATPKQLQGLPGGIGVRTLLEGGGTLVVSGDFTISNNYVWEYGGPMTVTGSYGGVDYKDAGANTGVLRIYEGKAITVKHDLTLDDIIIRPGDTISGIRVMSGATLTITDSVEILKDTMVIIVEAGATANIEGGTYKAIQGNGTINLGEKVKNLGAKLPGFISNNGGNNNNSGISDVSPRQNQGAANGTGIRNMLYGGGTLVVSGEFNISSNEAWDYGGEILLTGSHNGKDYKDAGANTGIFKLAGGKTLTLASDLVIDDILFRAGENSVLRVPDGKTLTIKDSVVMLTENLVIRVEKGGTANIEGGTYKSIQGNGAINLGEKVKITHKGLGFISNGKGGDSRDGLTPETAKQNQGQPDGTGIRNLLYNIGGTLVVVGDFNISSNEAWNYGAGVTVTVTGVYGGKDYKDYDLNTGIFKLHSDRTLSLDSNLTFDNILFLPGDQGSVLRVPEGRTLRITDTVDFQANTLSIVVEKGGTAILEGGSYISVSGEGDIRMTENVKILGSDGAKVPTEPMTAYISNTTGTNINDGLSANAPKQNIGAENGTGARSILAAGGTLVVSGDCGIKKNTEWKVGGAVTVTAKANGTDYRDAANGRGVIPFMPNAILTVASDLTLENVILIPSDTYNILRVQSGVTLTVGENVEIPVPNLVIEVEEGGKAIVESGSYLAIRGKGDIKVSDAVKIVKRMGVIDPEAPATSVQGKKVGFISNGKGKDTNDGLTPATPKQNQGSVGGSGLRNLMYGGGTIVLVGDMNFSSSEAWNYGGAMTVTGCYGGVDYRDYDANAGLFVLHSNRTLTVKVNLSMQDMLLQMGENSAFRVNNKSVFFISDTVTVVNKQGYEAGKWNITVEKGSVVVLSERVAEFFAIDGDGEVVIYKPSADTAAGEGAAGDSAVTPDTPTQGVTAEDGVVFLSGADGSNDNDGLSAQTPKKSFGVPFGNGVYSMLSDGGKIVLSGDLSFVGNHTWNFGGAITVTASFGGSDYKDSSSAEPATGCLKLASGAVLTVTSDLTLDDMLLFFEDGQNTVKVNGATFTVTDTVQLLSGTGDMPQCKLILENGATAVVPEALQALFSVEGGTVLPYEK